MSPVRTLARAVAARRRPRSTLTDDPALLELMLADLDSAPALYRPTNFWSTGLPSIVTDLRRHGIGSFRRHPSARAFYVPTYAPRSQPAGDQPPTPVPPAGPELRLARREYEVFRRNDSPEGLSLASVSESSLGQPVEQLDFDGRRYSRSMLNYLRALVFFKRLAPDANVRTVLEIGGGFATLGEILLQDNDITYVDVDIPPVAYVASRYLQGVFGRRRVVDYAVTRREPSVDLGRLTRQGRSAVLMPWQLPTVTGTVDLFVNLISFQEMEPDVVRNYARLITDLGTTYVLLRNARDGKPVSQRQGVLGVLEPVRRQTYLEAFSDFTLVGVDADVFGNRSETFVSEVMLLRRRSDRSE